MIARLNRERCGAVTESETAAHMHKRHLTSDERVWRTIAFFGRQRLSVAIDRCLQAREQFKKPAQEMKYSIVICILSLIVTWQHVW